MPLTLTLVGQCPMPNIELVRVTSIFIYYNMFKFQVDRLIILSSRVHTHARARTCTHAHIYTHTHTQTHTHTRTHTHTEADRHEHSIVSLVKCLHSVYMYHLFFVQFFPSPQGRT